MKITKPVQCAGIWRPGDFITNTWDNQRCTETNPRLLAHCYHCGKSYCLVFHWGKHACQ